MDNTFLDPLSPEYKESQWTGWPTTFNLGLTMWRLDSAMTRRSLRYLMARGLRKLAAMVEP